MIASAPSCRRAVAAVALALGLPLILAACTTAPPPASAPPLPAGTAVAPGETVRVGELAVTPIAVTEDSRCPAQAMCIWPGRLVVQTRIVGPRWQEIVPLTLGHPHLAKGRVAGRRPIVVLVAATPERVESANVPGRDYRFTYELGAAD